MKHKIQNQFLLYYSLLSICPLLLLATLSYFNLKANTEKDLSGSMIYNLKQSQATLDEKYTKITKLLDIVSNSIEFNNEIKIMSENMKNGNYDLAQYNGIYKMNHLLQSLFYADSDIAQALVVVRDRCVYSYNSYFPITKDLSGDSILQALYKTPLSVWRGGVDGPFEYFSGSYTVIARNINDFFSGKPRENIGQFVILLNQKTLTDCLKNSLEYSGNVIAAFDKDDRMIAITDKTAGNTVNIINAAKLVPPLGSDDYNPLKEISFNRHILTYNSSSISGWKLIQLTPEKHLKSLYLPVIMLTILLVLGLLSLMLLFSYLISKKLIAPIKYLAGTMKEAGKKNFSVSVPVHSENEIGEICKGFNNMMADLDRLFKLTIEKEEQKRQFQIAMLKYQINPHFLYNTLNSIRYSAITQNDHKTDEMLIVLSRLLRNTLTKSAGEVKLTQEVENIKDYICLHQIRYDNRLTVVYNIDPRTLDLFVPGMILQPIVENSIMHGLSDKLNSGCSSEIRISAWLESDDMLLISVSDNGSGIPEDKVNAILEDNSFQPADSSHIGIKNIHERLLLQYGTSYGITIESTVGVYTCVLIHMPVIHYKEENAVCLE